MSQQNFVKISLFFCHFTHFAKNHHNSCVHASILLKYGTRIGGLKANTSIDFWVNLINIEKVISDFTHKWWGIFHGTERNGTEQKSRNS